MSAAPDLLLQQLLDGLGLPGLAFSPALELVASTPAALERLGPRSPAAPAWSAVHALVARAHAASAPVEAELPGAPPQTARAFPVALAAPAVVVVLRGGGGGGGAADVGGARAREVSSLIPGIAHEIRGPLSALSGLAQVLVLDERLPHDFGEPLRLAVTQVDRVDAMLRNLVSLSRGPLAGDPLPASLEEALDRALALLAHELRVHRVLIERARTGRDRFVAADPEDLQLVLLTALRATLLAEGGERVTRVRLAVGGEDDGAVELRFELEAPPPAGNPAPAAVVACGALLTALAARLEPTRAGFRLVLRAWQGGG